jgi:hypothetical protein
MYIVLNLFFWTTFISEAIFKTPFCSHSLTCLLACELTVTKSFVFKWNYVDDDFYTGASNKGGTTRKGSTSHNWKRSS